VFRWAEKRGKVQTNPFHGLPDIPTGSRDRDRVLTDDELDDVWATTGTMPYPWGPFFRLALLTMQRREEVAAEMRWSRLSPDLAEWNPIVKGDKSHIVYLPEPEREILRQIPRIDGCDLVFTTTGKTPISGFSGAKELLLDQMAKARPPTAIRRDRASKLAPWWLHDFRRTGASVLAKLGFDPIVIDKILSHKPQKLRGVAGIYQRYDYAREQKRALEVWAAYVTGLGRDEPEVVDLAERRVRA
jgi:integrase